MFGLFVPNDRFVAHAFHLGAADLYRYPIDILAVLPKIHKLTN